MKRNKLGRTKYQHGGMGYVDGIETEKKNVRSWWEIKFTLILKYIKFIQRIFYQAMK